MKAILLSIRPNWVKLILNKKKIYEIRRQFPKDFVGWVYIYCTKDKNNLLHKNCANIWWIEDNDFQKKNKRLGIEQPPILNGKCVARFWCDKVLELRPFSYGGHTWWIEKTTTNYKQFLQILQRSLLTEKQIKDYAKRKRELFAVVVDKLEIFDEPKELIDFKVYKHIKTFKNLSWLEKGEHLDYGIKKPLTKAPQNFMYIETE